MNTHALIHTVGSLLQQFPAINGLGTTVETGAALNHSPHDTPWIGIYHGRLSITPRALGQRMPWVAKQALLLYIQASSHKGETDALQKLDALQGYVVTALLADTTIKGKALSIEELETTPFKRDLSADTWFFSNEISITFVLRSDPTRSFTSTISQHADAK